MNSVSQRLAALSPAKQALLRRAMQASPSTDDQTTPIGRRDANRGPAPLSFAQQRLWFLDQFDGPGATYNMPIAVRLLGSLNRDALHQTLQTIVQRHEALRTTIQASQGQPHQHVQDTLALALPETRLDGLDSGERAAVLAARMQAEATEPFDLARGPLIRAQLLKLDEFEHVLLLTIHHIVCDGWSIGKVLLGEMVELYGAYCRGIDASLPVLDIQYGDYAAWQRNSMTGPLLEQHLGYWTEALKGLPARLELPTDRPRPPVQTYRGDVVLFRIEPSQVTELKAFGQARKATLFMTLLAGFSSVLARYARQHDVAVGSPMAGRTHKCLEPLVGFFVNTLVLRTRLSDSITVDELIEQVRQTCLGAYQYQALPFERLVEALKPERTPSFSPLFQVMFILQNQNQERGGLTAGDLRLESLPVDAGTAMFDMTLKLEEQGGELLGEFEYNTDLFDRSTIERFVDHLQHLLKAMVANPASRVSQLPLMDEVSRRAMLSELRHAVWDEDGDTLLTHFDRRVTLHPQRVAIQCAGQTVTYAELHTRAQGLADQIQRAIGAGERPVGLCLSRTADMVVAMLATLMSGNAYVPIDPAYPKDRIQGMIDQGGLALILTDTEAAPSLPDTTVACWSSDQWLAAPQGRHALPTVHPRQLAYVIFTSGSTGRPKGVQISHAALLNFLQAMQAAPGLDEGDVLAAVTTISFDIAGLELYLPLMVGATVNLVDRATASDGFLLLEHLKRHPSTVMQATPSTWRMLFATGATELPLRRAFCGGEALDAALAEQMTTAGLDVWNLYGPTETTIWSTAGRVSRATGTPPIGQAIRGTSLYVLDPWLEPAGLGVPGELFIGGLGLSRGYLGQPGLTADRFVPDPFAPVPGGRMYRTGDLVIQRAQGRIDYVGRTDFQVKVRGFRIELGEIEAVLKDHPAISHAVAVARPGSDGNSQLVAYVETGPGWASRLSGDTPGQDVTGKWQTVWNETYQSADGDGDDFSGWFSSYTGALIGTEPMTAWTEETVSKILSLKPQRVLEIGCGTGLLARRLAPGLASYIGVDFSESVLQTTQARLAKAGLHNVELIACAADQIPVERLGTIDTLVINSVAQYFPSADYLIGVLSRLTPCLARNAKVFLGDLRSLPHLRVQHASVQAFKANPDETLGDWAKRLEQSVEAEEELLVDARWFLTPAVAQLGRPTHASITLKDGAFDHEMARFRYDLVLHLDQRPAHLQAQADVPRFQFDSGTGLASLATLARDNPGGFLLTAIPNARTLDAVMLLEALPEAVSTDTMARVASQQTTAHGVDPDQLRACASALGWSAVTGWDPSEPDRCFAALIVPHATEAVGLCLNALQAGIDAPLPATLVNQPGQADLTRRLVAQLRASLQDRLPAYMVPAAIVPMAQLPLTPNGKIDRAALPAPDAVARIEDYVAAQSAVETALAEIWSEVLAVERIGVRDHFFHLGGHSLLAVQVIAKIRDRLSVSLPIQALFDAPTIEQLVTRLHAQPGAHDDPIVAQAAQSREEAPLTHPQRQLWFLEQLQGASATYHVSAAADVRGPLNVEALRQSFEHIIQRHEALRTAFPEVNGEPVARLSAEAALDFSVMAVEADEHIAATIAQIVSEPFDLSLPGLVRIRVLRRDPHHHVLVMVMHHIVSDEWSIALVQQELAQLYPARCRGEPLALAPLAIQYGDYAVWQQDRLQVDRLAPSLSFWRAHLAQAPARLALPTDHPRPAVSRHRGAIAQFSVPTQQVTPLKTLAAEQGVTLFMTLLTGWATLLARRAAVDEVVIGVPMTDRSRSELEPLVGFFVNTLPIRIDLAGQPSSRILLKRVGQLMVKAFSHQHVPLDRIIEAVNPPRSLSHAPLFQVVFVMQNAPKAALSFADLTLTTRPTDAGVSKFDLTLSVEETETGLEAMVEYDTDLFQADTIGALLAELQTIWRGMCLAPDWPVAALPLLADDARLATLALPNAALPIPADQTVLSVQDRFEAQVRATPEAPAVAVGAETLSYAELNARADRVASHLIERGIGTDSVVGIHAEPSWGMVVSMLAVLKAGAAYLPMVPDTPAARLQTQLARGGVQWVLDTTGQFPSWSGFEGVVLDVSSLVDTPVVQLRRAHRAHPQGLACVIFTSGSTGEPKGVQVTHGNLAASVAARCHHYREPMTGLLLLQPFGFDVATGNIFWVLCSGGCLYLEPRQTAFEPEQLLRRIAQTRVSHLVLLPLLYSPLLAMASQDDLASLRCVVVGGEQMPAALVTQHRQVSVNATLYNEYGPTETTVMCAAHRLPLTDGTQTRVPIGQAMPNNRLYVLDDLLEPVPVGVEGELCIGGPQVTRGYAQRSAETAARFTPDPFSPAPGARLYRSGDRARLRSDGSVELVGRSDQQVKIRGFRIELGEIQTTLAELPGVADAAVIVIEQGQSKWLAGYAVPAAGQSLSETELRVAAAQRLPDYMVPAQVMILTELPRTSNGKLDVAALPKPVAEDGDSAPTLNATESTLADIWARVLGVNQVGRNDNFFALGGDSILSIQVVSRARQAGLRFSVRQLFEAQTVAQLAARVNLDRPQAEDASLAQASSPSPIQQWFLNHYADAPNHFNQSVMLLVDASCPDASLRAALAALVARHEGLSARYERSQDGWQIHWNASPAEPIALETIDLSALGGQAQREALLEHANRLQASLDISAGRLWCVARLRFGAQSPDRLLWIVHHLAVDGVSWRILLEDLEQAVTQHRQTGSVTLATPSHRFATWVARLQDHAQSPSLANERDHWLAQLQAGVDSLPLDKPDVDLNANTFDSARTLTVSLPADVSDALLRVVPDRYQARINDVLLAALQPVLCDWTGLESVGVTLESHGREALFDDIDIGSTVGWFTATYPVRLTGPLTASGQQRVRAIKQQRQAIPNHGIGFGLLRYLGKDRALADALAHIEHHAISFNYLGQFRNGEAGGFIVGQAPEPVGQEHRLEGLRPHIIDINGLYSEGCLHFSWTYSQALHERQTIERLAQAFAARLQAMVTDPSFGSSNPYTPGDFPLARLSTEDTERLFERAGHNVVRAYPLSATQQGMLFHSELSRDSGAYVMQLSCDILAPFDPSAFQQAWQAILDRHDSLRLMVMIRADADPLQVILRKVDLPWVALDWRHKPPEQADQDWQTLLQADRRQGFDPSQAPLMRCSLVQVSDKHWQFLWTHHHIQTDGWCLSILLKELLAFYHAQINGTRLTLPAAPAYEDYIAWLGTRDSEAARVFWRQQFAGLERPTPLGIDRQTNGTPRRKAEGNAFQTLTHRLEADETLRLTDHLRRQGLTLSLAIQLAWAALLSRYGDQRDVVFGATSAGRPPELPGVEQMVGLFIATLPVRLSIQPGATVTDLLVSLREGQLARDAHAHLPLPEIQRVSGIDHRSELFDSIVVFENYPVDAALNDPSDKTHALNIQEVRFAEQTNYALTLTVQPGSTVPLSLSWPVGRFDSEAIEHLLASLARLLVTLPAMAHESVQRWMARAFDDQALDWQRQRLNANNSLTSQPTPGPAPTLLTRLAEQVRQRPMAPAVTHGTTTLSYQQLSDRVDALAAMLQARGVSPGQRVAVLMPRGLAMMASLLAVLKAGAAYVPIDPGYPADRVQSMLADCGAVLAISEQDVAIDRLDPAQVSPTPGARQVTDQALAHHVAYVIYTSGSTGKPKGVQVTHANLSNFLTAMAARPGLGPDNTLLAVTTISFDIAGLELFLPLWTGAHVVIADREAALDGQLLRGLLQAFAVDVMQATPTTWRLLLEAGWRGDSLKQAWCGGEAMPGDLAEKLCGLGLSVWNLYGPTETTIWSTAQSVDLQAAHLTSIPIGQAIDNTTLYIVDGQDNPVPWGVPGELLIGGAGVARGYMDRPALTAERFIPNGFDPVAGARLYRTGDRVWYDEIGQLHCLGRLDFQIKIRGFRIEPGEIEVTLRAHPLVHDCVVSVWEPASDDQRLVAHVVLKDPSADIATVRDWITTQLPAHLVPADWVALPALPLTPNGKVDRKSLPSPQQGARASAVEPRSETERVVAELFAQVLGVTPVGATDDFFDLGGHSLLAGRLAARIANQMGVQVPIAALFEHSVVCSLAEYLDNTRWATGQDSDRDEDHEEFRL